MNLPQNWIMTTIGNVTSPRGVKLKPSQMEDAPFIGLQHVEAHTMRLIGIGRTRDVKSSGSYFRRGDVLYGRLRPYLNKIYMPDFDGLASGEFIVFPSQQFLDNSYLKYFLNQWEFASFATRINAGDRPRVDFIQFSGYPIPLPPFPEQHRIVAEIEKQLTRLDASVASLERVRANLRRYRTSVLEAACEGNLVATEAELARAEGRQYEHADELLERILKERRALWESQPSGRRKYKEAVGTDVSHLPSLPEGWAWATVEQVASLEPNSITDGPFGSNLKTSHYTDDGPRVIRLQNIGDGQFINAYAHISWEHYRTLAKHVIEAGDLVIGALGQILPRSCLIPSTVGPAIVKADCIRFRPAHNVALAAFLNIALNADSTRTRTANIVHGVGRPRLNLGEIKSLSLPLPPIAEQHRIVAEVERRLSIIQQVEEAVDTSLKRAEQLHQSVLRQAFRGRLVPQDPDDEPASALLERMLAEGAQTQAATEVNRKRGRRTRLKARAVS